MANETDIIPYLDEIPRYTYPKYVPWLKPNTNYTYKQHEDQDWRIPMDIDGFWIVQKKIVYDKPYIIVEHFTKRYDLIRGWISTDYVELVDMVTKYIKCPRQAVYVARKITEVYSNLA